MHTLRRNIIFLLLEINLKFSAAGVHPPFIPMTQYFLKARCFISFFSVLSSKMSMITADRVACHDIGIVTVPKDYNVCLEQPTSNMVKCKYTADTVVHGYIVFTDP